MANRIQLRRDTTQSWNRVNPILADGEPGLNITTNQIKYGDGNTPWRDLPYESSESSGNGYTGSASDVIGYTGSLGYTGSNGSGYTGSASTDVGYTGSKGDQGQQGVSVTLKGSVATVGDLPSSNQSAGDAWIVTADGNMYFWDITNTTWDNIGKIVGYTGSRGQNGYFGSVGYIGSTGPAATVGTLNYVQNSQATSTSMSGSPSYPFTVISAPAITTNGSPVQVIVTGDANPISSGNYCLMRLFRGSTAIGQVVQAESTTANVNVPYCIQFVDAVAAGTYTYSMKVVSGSGAFNFGEATGPVITVTELQNVIGATGYTGSVGVLTGAIPAWTSAGAITITATTTNPSKGATRTQDNISYRQIGAKEWEVVLTYIQTALTGGATGSGDYLITLPNGLSFDTTLPSQQIYTGGVGASLWSHLPYVIPNCNGTITNNTVGGQIFPMVYSATKFRILTLTYGSGIQCWGSGYYSIGGDNPRIQLTFKFTST